MNPNGDDDVETRLLHHRVVWHDGDVDATAAARLSARLLLLACEDEREPVGVYLSSAGGTTAAALAVADVLGVLPCPVTTLALGDVEGPGVLVLAAGTRGRRSVLSGAVLVPRSSDPALVERLRGLTTRRVEVDRRHDAAAAVSAGLVDVVLDGPTSLSPARLGRPAPER